MTTQGKPTPITDAAREAATRPDGTVVLAHLAANMEDAARSLERANAALVEALEAVTADAAQAIEDAGGCDHSVGICMCPEIRNVERAREVLKQAKGEA